MKSKSRVVFSVILLTLFSCGGSDGPSLDSISPDHGSMDGGTTVTITGGNFKNIIQVTIGNVECTPIHIVSENELTCVSGPNPNVITDAIVDVGILNDNGNSGSLENAFTYESH